MPLPRHRWDVTEYAPVHALAPVQGAAELDAQEPVAVGAVKPAKDIAKVATRMTK